MGGDTNDEQQDTIDEKNMNRETYSKNHQKNKKGKRPHSPWWYLLNKLERRFLNKNTEIDYPVNQFKPIKIKLKKKDHFI